MKRDVYYLIRPKNTLLERLSDYAREEEEYIGPFIEPTLWERGEGGMRLDQISDRIPFVKLVFLGNLKQIYGQEAVFDVCFGDEFQISTQMFDRFWTIERFDISDNLDTMIWEIDFTIWQEAVPTNNRLADRWIEEIKEKMRQSGE